MKSKVPFRILSVLFFIFLGGTVYILCLHTVSWDNIVINCQKLDVEVIFSVSNQTEHKWFGLIFAVFGANVRWLWPLTFGPVRCVRVGVLLWRGAAGSVTAVCLLLRSVIQSRSEPSIGAADFTASQCRSIRDGRHESLLRVPLICSLSRG